MKFFLILILILFFISPNLSYAFSQSYEKNEAKLYTAVKHRDFKKAGFYLNYLLKTMPQDTKLLKLGIDIAIAQSDFEKALSYFNEIHKTVPLSFEDEEFLAFLYYKNGETTYALNIIEKLLEKDSENKELLHLALKYSAEQKDWDKAIFYNEKLLEDNPSDENLIKSEADLYLAKKKLNMAINSYENLVENYPKSEYKLELFNLYMVVKDFTKAQKVIEALYAEYPCCKNIITMYINSLSAQNKLDDAFCLVKKHCLQNTKEGAIICADKAMKNKDYNFASKYYLRAVNFDRENVDLKLKLAQSYRMMKNSEAAAQVYYDILSKDISNKDALLGLGYLKIDEKFYPQARQVFREILLKEPDYTPAKLGMVYSYANNGDNLNALKVLKQIPNNDNVRLLKANTYYQMGMPSDAKNVLKGMVTKEAEDLKYRIKRDEAITIIPGYKFFNQVLFEEFDLDYDEFSLSVVQGTKNNLKIFADCNIYSYDSGKILAEHLGTSKELSNVTTELKLGVMGRPEEKFEFNSNLGAKIFQFNQGYMLNTDSWIKHYFNDKSNIKLGFYRDNLEQTYVSAVGTKIKGVFTGQVSKNKLYFDYEYRFPHQFYSFINLGGGQMLAQNLQSNPFWEGTVGFGRLMYNNPNNKWVNFISLDITSHDSGYQYNNLLIIEGLDHIYGGYYCPNFFTSNTANLKIEGKIKKIRYGFKFSGGYQYNPEKEQIPLLSKAAYVYWPYIAWDVNDHVSLNLYYNYNNIANIVKNTIGFNIVFKGFEKKKQS